MKSLVLVFDIAALCAVGAAMVDSIDGFSMSYIFKQTVSFIFLRSAHDLHLKSQRENSDIILIVGEPEPENYIN